PPSMLGTWCIAVDSIDKKVERYERRRGCIKYENDGFFEVSPNAIEGHEWGCDRLRITRVDRTYEASSSRCSGEGEMWSEKFSIWVEGRYLMRKTISRGNERPDLGTLECRGHVSTPPDTDANPVVLTLLNFDETFDVRHVMRSGKVYRRSDQFRDIQIWTNDM